MEYPFSSNVCISLLILNNKDFIADETIAYMSSSWGSFDYNEVTCRRDLNYIIDSVRTDLVYGGNQRTRLSAEYYFLYPSDATGSQLIQTTDAINYASRIAQKVVVGEVFTTADTNKLNASNLLSKNKKLIANEVVADGRFDLIIVDEANAYKNVSTRRWKALNKLIKPTTYLWMMTGTPAAQSPADAYGLAKLVNPMGVPQFQTAWRDKTMLKVTQFKWVPKKDAHMVVFDALQPAIRYTKEECTDLPPVLVETREIPLTAQQKKYYMMLKELMVVQAANTTISAVNAAAGVSKLLQISAGAAYTDDKEVVEFDCAPRLSVLMEVLEETKRKVLVFAPFRHSIDTIHNYLNKHGVANELIHGDISVRKRTDIFKRFQTEENPRLLVIQPQAAAHGVTLTAADTVIFWGPVMSVETYKQCIARSDRIGQDSTKVTVIHLQGSDIAVG